MQDHALLVNLEFLDRTGTAGRAKAIEETLHDGAFPVYTVHDPR